MRTGQQPGIARHVDDGTATGGSHWSHRVSAAEEGALQVRVDTRVPVRLGHLLNRLHHADSGIVDQDVQPSRPPDRLVDRRGQLGFPSHVAGDLDDPQFVESCGVGLDVSEVGGQHRRSVFGQQDGCCPPDSVGSPRNDGCTPREVNGDGHVVSPGCRFS